jgi:signal transduction histidine kinase/CheY-like chemotaxis protein
MTSTGTNKPQDLRRCVRELLALSAQPAIWIDYDSGRMAESLADVLVSTLRADLVYLNVKGRNEEVGLEVVRTSPHRSATVSAEEIRKALAPVLKIERSGPPTVIANPVGSGTLRLAVMPLEHGAESGFVVVGSQHPEFADQTDRLLLSVAGNHFAILLQHRRTEQERARLVAGERSARAEAESARRKAAFLAEAGAALASSLGYRATLATVVRLAVPSFADWCFIDVVEKDGQLRRLDVAHTDPVKMELAKQLRHFPPRRECLKDPPASAFYSRQAVFISDVTPEMKERAAQSEQHLRALQRLDFRSLISVPLAAHGTWFGVLTFLYTSESSRRYTPDDLPFAEEITRRAALALENARLYRQAREQAEALREADRRKDIFLATLAHELRSPLAPIRNAAQVLKLVGGEDRDLEWARGVIERQVTHMTRLVDDLLDVSRITRGKVQLKREPIDAASVVVQAVESTRPMVELRQHRLEVSLPARPVRLEGDLTRLAQVIANLINNSCKYQDQGGRIWLTLGREGSEAVFRVKDAGKGISREMLPRVFDLFTQVDPTLDHSEGGLGIGLSLVKSLVELHGGRVEAHSAGPGEGSEFVVRLPALDESAQVRAEVESPQRPREQAVVPSRRVLLVDDDRDTAETSAMLLKLWGQEVRVAYDGPSGLEAAKAFQPDVILLDIGLPGMSGYELARRLRAQPGLEKALFVATTGYGTHEDKRRAYDAGFQAHLTKPVDPAALQALLANPGALDANGTQLPE